MRAQTMRLSAPSPQLNLGGSITVSATPGNISFSLVSGGTAAGSAPLAITTKASNVGLLSSLSLYGYFGGAAALTSAEGATISGSNVWASSDAQPGYQSFTAASPFAPQSSVLIFRSYSLLDLLTAQGHQNTLTLRIDLSGTPQQPAGQYVGTLVLQAQLL